MKRRDVYWGVLNDPSIPHSLLYTNIKYMHTLSRFKLHNLFLDYGTLCHSRHYYLQNVGFGLKSVVLSRSYTTQIWYSIWVLLTFVACQQESVQFSSCQRTCEVSLNFGCVVFSFFCFSSFWLVIDNPVMLAGKLLQVNCFHLKMSTSFSLPLKIQFLPKPLWNFFWCTFI